LEEGEGWEGKEGWEGEEREKDRDHGKGGERVVVAGTSASVHGKARGAADDDVEEETLAEHGRLFLRNLAYDVTDEDIQALFRKFGPLSEVHLPVDKNTRRAKGTAYVHYSLGEHAVRAMAALDGTFFQGRIVHIMPSQAPPRYATKPSGVAAGFKASKEEQLKASAGSMHNWNTLFMRSDAVGDAVASRYGVAKRDLLSSEGEVSAAVRLAQGETHVIQQTKEWLSQHGISLETLQSIASGGVAAASTERSKTMILIKNIASSVTEQALSALFGKYGKVGHLMLAPANTLALVEFLEVGDAKRAFRGLAYSKLQGAPLFLEWAPIGVTGPASPTLADGEEAARGSAGVSTSAEQLEGAEPSEEVDESEGCTLFVKNLNFKTSSADLRALFECRWRVRSASVVRKKDPKHAGETISMGYGFVELSSPRDAQQALRQLHNSRLDDHVLQIKMSSRGASGPTSNAGKLTDRSSADVGTVTSTLMVRNLPFEANKKEVRELFSTFGQLKTVRALYCHSPYHINTL